MLFVSSITSLGMIIVLAVGTQALIASSFNSFGGVNHQSLQFLDPVERDKVITAAVEADARVIRLFS